MKSGEPVAIVGIGCRLPGGIRDAVELASFLRQHGDAVKDVPRDRWNAHLHYHADPQVLGKAYVKRAAFLCGDVFAFDPEPFGISPREADQLDPQQRLLLETSWEAFEDAGIPIDRLRGSDTAVYVGGFTLDHQTLAYAETNRRLVSSHTSTGSSLTMLSNRLSYTFDLRGPSMTVDTACSSSLVATHLACEALRRGDCQLALAAGVTVMLSPATMVAMSKGHFLAPDGRSKTFDARADGYGRGEGAAVVVLKRLTSALRDGDRIYAVIAATGVNQDGRTDGISSPSELAQRELSAQVLAASGLRASDIGYIEAHGTGTRAGDQVEVRALGAVYGRQPGQPLTVGSIKTNIGHLESAAGVTGLIKAALSIQRREIFPLRELGEISPEIDFDALNLRPALELEPWPERPIVAAAVNAFGYGGTNAHAVLFEAPGLPAAQVARRPLADERRLVPLSAASDRALHAGAAELAPLVTPEQWSDQAYSLALHRAAHAERAVILAGSAAELRAALQQLARGEQDPRIVTGRAAAQRRLLWVYTGMGPQWWGMGQELYASEPIYRAAVERADQAYAKVAGHSILERMRADAASSRMASNDVAQPANFVLQVGLTELLRSLGVPQHGILGHSVGEVAAAWATGCLSLEQAAALSFERSRIQQTIAGRGTMLAAAISADEAQRLATANPGVVVAAYNAAKSVALAGETRSLQQIAQELDARGVFNRMMPVEVAYHSPQMEPLRAEMLRAFAPLTPHAPRLPLFSTLRGARVEQACHDAEYFWQNARQPVLLQQALEAACREGYDAFLEIGPHPVLGAAMREVARDQRRDARSFHALKRSTPERDGVLRCVAELHVGGVPLDWRAQYPRGRRVELPKYAFQREHHWAESASHRDARVGSSRTSGLFSAQGSGPKLALIADLNRADLSYLTDHVIQDTALFPGAGYLDAALGAALQRDADRDQYVLEDIRFERAMMVRPNAAPELTAELDDLGRLELHGRHDGQAWARHATCRYASDARDAAPCALDLERLRAQPGDDRDIDETYQRFAGLGLQYGPAFRRLRTLRVSAEGDGSRMLARLDADRLAGEASCLHPSVLDCAFQALLAAAPELATAMVPTSIERVRFLPGAGAPVWAVGRVVQPQADRLIGELSLADAHGRVLFEARGLICRSIASAGAAATPLARWIHADAWRPASAAQTWELSRSSAARCVLLGDAPLLNGLGEQLAELGLSLDHALDAAPASAGERLVVLAIDSAIDPSRVADVCSRAVACVQRLPHASALRIVTTGAYRIDPDDVPSPVQTALWGLGRVVMTELPQHACRLLDVTHDADPAQVARLLLSDLADEELSLRQGQVLTRRLERIADGRELEFESRVIRANQLGNDGYQLTARASAASGADSFAAFMRRSPDAGEIELEVDCLQPHAVDGVPGRTPNDAPLRVVLGRAARVGSGVAHIRAGQLTLALHRGFPASHILVDARAAVVVPESARDWAGAIGELLVAWHALVVVGGLRAGERVRVHGASGRLGGALARVVSCVGATVADSDASAISGVELVANLLDEPARSRAFELLRPGGRLVDLYAGATSGPVELRAVRRGIVYVAPDLESAIAHDPAAFRSWTETVLAKFGADVRSRVIPFRADPESLRELWSALEADTPAYPLLDLRGGDAQVRLDGTSERLFREDRTYLVTGGLAGFGLATAEWLVERGVRQLVLAARRPPDATASLAIARMRRAGACVICRSVDVSDSSALDALFEFMREQCPALAGVFHSAMVLDDQPLATLTPESIARVLAPKAHGAWLLYEKTQHLSLEHFVLYSSVSAQVGNPHQASYAAANSFLDGLAELCHARGRAATSVSFGALGDVGVVARNSATQAHLEGLGFAPIPAKQALAAVGWGLRSGLGRFGVIEARWDRWMGSFPAVQWTRLSALGGDADPAAASALDQLRTELAPLAEDERRRVVSARLRAVAAEVFRLDPRRIDASTPLKSYGLDSLMAVELQSALELRLGLGVPTMQLLAGVSSDELSEHLLAALDHGPTDAPAPALAPSVEHDAGLRSLLLERICVQPPYFDLLDIVRDGEWIVAKVSPTPPSEDELDAVSCAEAARHLAIVGSCAVSWSAPMAGKVYYPVRRAQHVTLATESQAASSLEALEQVIVRGRCVAFDALRSQASAETELTTLTGEVLYRLSVDYHVIPEAEFRRLFEDRAAPTHERTAPSPYQHWHELSAIGESAGEYSCELGRVDPLDCVGHFVGYPALPVSIMTRRAIQLTAEAFRRATGREGAQIRVVAGEAETHAFIFAHEPARLSVRRVGVEPKDGLETWVSEVHGPAGIAARFELKIAPTWPRVSSVRRSGWIDRTG